ncbi:hypothetical protein KZY63_12090, partial [Prevotella histicola]|uniref:hypothetical protein n=1 Tax=Prevotella histicola TaxID=470565 RepID=UPI001C5E2084
LQTRAAYKIDKVQQLQFTFALGNTYPRINTINNVEQQIDPIREFGIRNGLKKLVISSKIRIFIGENQ